MLSDNKNTNNPPLSIQKRPNTTKTSLAVPLVIPITLSMSILSPVPANNITNKSENSKCLYSGNNMASTDATSQDVVHQ
eukprot:7447099-Ditylum_brightwellii.AAC.1